MFRLTIDPTDLGNLEIGWWKAHNEKDKPRMVKLLIDQNMAMYGFTEVEAEIALRSLVKGVKYHDTREWDKAINSVTGYYEKIKEKTGLKFDANHLAQLEVGWWKLHDELEFNPDKSELAVAFAKLYATEFGLTLNEMKEAGRLKAEATKEHDLAESPDTRIENVDIHWNNANKLLVSFYKELERLLT